MSSEFIIRIFDLLGIITGVVLLKVVFSFRKSLEGSFFGRYSRLMIVAAILFASSFIIELIGEFMISEFLLTDIIPHIFIIISGVLIVYAGIILPKEAMKVLKETNAIK